MATTKKSTSKKIPTPAIDKAVKIALADTALIADAGKSELKSFLNFVREQGIIGLAVGLAVGTAAGASVKQIVDGIINPVVGFIIGGIDLTQLKWVAVAPGAGGKGGLVFSWGAVVSSLITLTATAFVIYWLIHFAKLDRLDKKKDE
jgi:large conductance mechanosensitive channel